jgi:superfamily II DNA or RNA helicase
MATSIRLRPWQRAALDRFTAAARPDFLAVATPGAGKTTFALTAAAQSISRSTPAERRARRIVVVAPTQHLKLQWALAADRFGLHLEPDWSARDGALPGDVHGVVTTYQQVATSAGALRHLAAGSFVILDEVHHAGDDRAWGSAILEAFGSASQRLSLSGTPFRSDTSPIPFVEYHLDEARPDFEYGYGDALVDGGVVRPVFFPRIGGHMEWVDHGGDVVSAAFDDELDRQRANQRLRTALSLEGDWLPTVLVDAHERLLQIRRVHPDAAGLVIATDQAHATGIAALLARRCGVTATVAVSDDPLASAKIARFAASTDPWIVAVRMVSEGVDIPRLRVGVFATNTTTELFFRQAVGRLVRWTRGVRAQKSFLFIPDDPRLRRWATGIAEQRRHSVAKRRGGSDDPIPDDAAFDDRDAAAAADADGEQMSLFAVISAVADAGEVVSLFDDHHDDLDHEDDDGEARADLDDDAALEVHIDVPVLHVVRGDGTDDASSAAPVNLRQRRAALRKRNSEAVAELSRFVDLDHRQINAELNRLAGVAKVSEATVEQLQRRLDAANAWLRRPRSSAR